MHVVLKKLLSVLSAAGPVGWISIVALAAMATIGYAIHELTGLVTPLDAARLEYIQWSLRFAGKEWRFKCEKIPGGPCIRNHIEDPGEPAYDPMRPPQNLLRRNPQSPSVVRK